MYILHWGRFGEEQSACAHYTGVCKEMKYVQEEAICAKLTIAE